MPKQEPLFRKLYYHPYGYTNSFDLFDSTKNSKDLLQRLRLQIKIPAHTGCVNSICWNENGRYLLSGSDDRNLCVTDGYSHTVLAHITTGHRSNIFSAKFLPGGDNKVISCSGDGVIIYSDFEDEETSMVNKFNCHFGTAYEVMTIPNDPNTFLSCGEDGTVRWFDLRIKTTCLRESCKEDVLINCHSGVSALGLNPVYPYQLAVGCADSTVRIFDRRMLCTSATGGFRQKSGIEALMANFTVPEFTNNHRITSLKYSQDGQEMLISYSSDFIYLFDVKCSFDKDPKVLSRPSKDSSKNGKNNGRDRPFMKRLRVRGDWSDTGPNARPESEATGEPQSRTLRTSLMQRLSDALTNMYNQRSRGQPTTVSSSSHSEDSEMEDGEGNSANDPTHGPDASPSNSSTSSTEASGSYPYQVPTFSLNERIDEENEEESDVRENDEQVVFDEISAVASPEENNESDEQPEGAEVEKGKEAKTHKGNAMVAETAEVGKNDVETCVNNKGEAEADGKDDVAKVDKNDEERAEIDENVVVESDANENIPREAASCESEKVDVGTNKNKKEAETHEVKAEVIESNKNQELQKGNEEEIERKNIDEEMSEENSEEEMPEGNEEVGKPSHNKKVSYPSSASNSKDINVKVSAFEASRSFGTGDSSLPCNAPSHSTDSNPEVLNLSVQNIKQEMFMLRKMSGEKNNSVINTNSCSSQDSGSGVFDGEPGTGSFKDEGSPSAASNSALSTQREARSQIESPSNICDSQEEMDATSSSDTRDAPTSAIESNESNDGHDSASSPVPHIFVATVPPSGQAISSRQQSAGQSEDQMTLMMEMDSWDVDSDEDGASPRVPRYSRINFNVPSEIATLEDEVPEEDIEQEEQDHMNEVPHPQITNKFMGHRNARTMIKEATFWGNNFIMSGSDCGHIFVWDRYTSELVMLMEADHHVVNCLQPHPFDPILASSGIDYDIKIWSPSHNESLFDEEKANEIIKRNKVMLEETKDTITVPATFMIRMLASLNHITSGSGWRRMARHLREGARRYR